MNPYLVGISGGSASGKTRLVAYLQEILPPTRVCFISQDNYYHTLEDQVSEADGSVNFDHPRAVNLERLHDDLRQLMNGQTVEIQEYTFNNPALTPRLLRFEPSPILVIEGLFVFHYQPVAELLDLKLYVDAEEHLKLSRRLRRDLVERGYPMEDILTQYEQYTMPMYRRFVEPYKSEADILLYNNRHFRTGATVIRHHLEQVLEHAGQA